MFQTEQLEVQNPLFEGGESIAQGHSANGSCGEIVNPSDLDDGSDNTPTVKTARTQLQKKRTYEAEFGGSTLSKRSPVDSLLGEATVTSLEGDRKLAHSAQMYHYQHQKQQMLAVDRASDPTQVSEDGSESDVEEGDFTVYECPGLAEVSLFHSTVY
ncbi:hypothetical protein AHF37_02346 [Paragonimus kellicotti]|nr:hypothetical protein AHF37_02346 [Paragonimus kellicotti]